MKLIVLVIGLVFSLSVQAIQSAQIAPLEDTYEYHNFGRVRTHSQVWAAYKITNDGDEDLLIDRVGIAGPMDFAAWYDCGKVIPVGGACRVDLRYMPFAAGIHSGTFIMAGVENKWNLYIRLWGEAY